MMDPMTRLQLFGQIALIDAALANPAGYAAQKLLAEYADSGFATVNITADAISLDLLGIRAAAGPSRNRHTEEPTRPTCAAALRAWQHAARDRMTHPGVTV